MGKNVALGTHNMSSVLHLLSKTLHFVTCLENSYCINVVAKALSGLCAK